MKKHFYLIICIFCKAVLISQDYNCQLLSHVAFSDNSSNIWGYVDGKGREYAIIGRVTGTTIFDISQPSKPVLLIHIPGVISSWREIKSWKDHLYVVADRGADGVLIINMAQAPDKITYLFWKPSVTVSNPSLNFNKTGTIDRSHDLFIDEKGYCYLTGSNFHQGVVVLDLNKNPDNPEVVNVFNPNYTHDSYAVNDTFWSADILAGEFTVWNVKDKKNPVKLANQRTGNAFTHNIWLSDDHTYAFTTDERANAYVEAYRVDHLSNITLVDRYRSKTTQIRNTIPHNTYYLKGFEITSYYTDGFTIVDAHDPAHLVEVGSFDTYPAGDGDFHGCWGVYPYLPSGNIIASDIEFGLYVVKPTYKRTSYLKGTVIDSVTSNPISGAIIKLNISPFYSVNSNADGSFKSGGPYYGSASITVTKPGYIPITIPIRLDTLNLASVLVKLKPANTANLKIKIIDAITKSSISNAAISLISPLEIKKITSLNDSIAPLLTEGSWQITAGAWGYKYKNIYYDLASTGGSVTIELERGYTDHFLFNTFGWTAESTSSGGIWSIAEPLGTYNLTTPINPELDVQDDFGDQCAVTGNGSTSVIGDDIDHGYSRLISPNMDLSSFKKPFLSFYAWTARLNTVDSVRGQGFSKVSMVSGIDTVLIDTLLSSTLAWKYYSYNLDLNKLSNQNNVKIVFETSEPSAANATNILECAVDVFSLVDLNLVPTNNSLSANKTIKIFPNPAEDHITITSPEKNYDRPIRIYTVSGELVSKNIFPHGLNEMNWYLDLIPGVYFLSMEGKGEREVAKFIRR